MRNDRGRDLEMETLASNLAILARECWNKLEHGPSFVAEQLWWRDEDGNLYTDTDTDTDTGTDLPKEITLGQAKEVVEDLRRQARNYEAGTEKLQEEFMQVVRDAAYGRIGKQVTKREFDKDGKVVKETITKTPYPPDKNMLKWLEERGLGERSG